MPERIICIEWEGPCSHSRLSRDRSLLSAAADCGLYQIYAHHPVYGAGVLVYIGLAADQCFRNEILKHNFGGGSEDDPENVQVYIGRLKYPEGEKIDPSQWKQDVRNAERLLIHAHGPAYNSTNIMAAREHDDDNTVREARVISLGHFGLCIGKSPGWRGLPPAGASRRIRCLGP